MNTILTTLRRELLSYFYSPVGWLIAALFYLFYGNEVFSLIVQVAAMGGDRDQLASAYLFQGSVYVLIALVPAILTMRCFAEERRTGSLEVLMTAPVRSVEVVLGKWLAAWAFFLALLLPTLLLLLVLTWSPYLAMQLPFGPVLSGYLGMALLGSMLLAVGCFTSSLTDNQLLASLSSILFNIGLLSVGARSLSVTDVREEHAWFETLLQQINVSDHLSNWFARGLVDTSQVAFYVFGTAFFLFLCTVSVESRRWR